MSIWGRGVRLPFCRDYFIVVGWEDRGGNHQNPIHFYDFSVHVLNIVKYIQGLFSKKF